MNDGEAVRRGDEQSISQIVLETFQFIFAKLERIAADFFDEEKKIGELSLRQVNSEFGGVDFFSIFIILPDVDSRLSLE